MGSLEAKVLEVLWASDTWLTGREIFERLSDGSRAYTTVMTVLSRLVDKSLVVRSDDGGALRFRAAGDPDQLAARAILDLLATASNPRVTLAHFVDGLTDPELVAQLASALERQRRS